MGLVWIFNIGDSYGLKGQKSVRRMAEPGVFTLRSAQSPVSLLIERSLKELPELGFLSCTGPLPKFKTQTSHNLGFLTFLFLCPFLPTITKSLVPGISSTSYSGFSRWGRVLRERVFLQQKYDSRMRTRRQKEPRKVRGKMFARAAMAGGSLRFRDQCQGQHEKGRRSERERLSRRFPTGVIYSRRLVPVRLQGSKVRL